MRKNKLLLLLALLLTAATGAWAQGQSWDSGDCTVTLSDDVMTVSGAGAMADYEDTKWTITPSPATAGQTVTIQYTGRLKVKGVKATSDAAPAKEPATVTTAPTGAAIVGVGKTTAQVSGGAADGGTLMYAVTTTDTQPTSTE